MDCACIKPESVNAEKSWMYEDAVVPRRMRNTLTTRCEMSVKGWTRRQLAH